MTIQIMPLGEVPYEPTWKAMQAYTESRGPEADDQLWLLQHPKVFTQGLNGKAEHLLAPGDIPVVAVDRGGQVTYHGPGQIVIYTLIDLKRRGLGVRAMVTLIEESIVELLAGYGIEAAPRKEAPGVYVQDRKIAALGLRVRRGSCYHGLSLNVDMDMEPFSRINPCGYAGMPVTQLKDEGGPSDVDLVGYELLEILKQRLEKLES